MPTTRTMDEARTEFRKRYGDTSYRVVCMLLAGYSDNAVMSATGISRTSLNTYRGNLTRNAYGRLLAECRFTPRWSTDARNVVSLLRAGMTPHQVAQKLHMRRTRVATFAANFTRGHYDKMA